VGEDKTDTRDRLGQYQQQMLLLTDNKVVEAAPESLVIGQA